MTRITLLTRLIPRTASPERHLHRGFTLVELMVAMAIALFLIGGLVTVLQNIRSTSQMQTQLAQLQDNERLAMTMIAGVVETAGYFPSPNVIAATAAMPTGTGSSFTTAGTPVITGTTNAQGDVLTVRYAAAQNDNAFNCQGGTNTTVAPYDSWENTFSVDANNDLVCTLWKASTQTAVPSVLITGVPGVSGVQSMTVWYGVQTPGGAGTGACTDTYMTAAQVTAKAYWGNVCSALVTLTFFDPTNKNAAKLPTISRVIALMQTAGVTS